MNDSLELASKQTTSRGKSATPAEDDGKLVDAPTLLSLLWEEASRPSLRWLREQQARRTIPYVKLGARVWFVPSEVRRCLREKWTSKQR